MSAIEVIHEPRAECRECGWIGAVPAIAICGNVACRSRYLRRVVTPRRYYVEEVIAFCEDHGGSLSGEARTRLERYCIALYDLGVATKEMESR